MDIQQLNEYLTNKKALLYGDKDIIIDFIERFASIIDISAVISDISNEIIVQPYSQLGIPTIELESVIHDSDMIVIVCSMDDRFSIYDKRLKFHSKSEYKDYIDYKLIDCIINNKQLVVLMGNQLMRQIYNAISCSDSFKNYYSIIYYAQNELMKPYCNNYTEYIHVCKCCDIYIYSKCELYNYSSKIVDSSLLNANCRSVTISDFGFSGYYPDYDTNRNVLSDYMLREHHQCNSLDYEMLVMSRCDKHMLDLCQEHTNASDVYDALIAESHHNPTDILSHFNDELERIKECEKSCDIKIADYISQNRNRLLFINLSEMDYKSILYYVSKIFEHLNICIEDLDETKVSEIISSTSGTELILYPQIASTLNVEFSTNRLYKVVTYYTTKYYTFEEYLHFCIEYLLLSIDLLEYTGMDQNLRELK